MKPYQNGQTAFERLIRELDAESRRPRLLLHSCCGPCSSYVLETLYPHFEMTVYYYNPNIHPQEEYLKRKAEQLRLLDEYAKLGRTIAHCDAEYDERVFYEAARGLEDAPEGGARCTQCFALRLKATADEAQRQGCEFFGTTLSVSPHKNAALINELGADIARERAPLRYLISDFKKRGGYQRSIELSRQYALYRQIYCGCAFSINPCESRASHASAMPQPL